MKIVFIVCTITVFTFVMGSCFKPVEGEADTDSVNFTTKINISSESAHTKAPKADFQNPVFTFQPVEEGARVVHDFIVRNRGNDALLIKNVRTD